MLKIETFVDKSPIEGLGVFEKNFVKKGEELTTDYKTLVPKELWEDYYTK